MANAICELTSAAFILIILIYYSLYTDKENGSKRFICLLGFIVLTLVISFLSYTITKPNWLVYLTNDLYFIMVAFAELYYIIYTAAYFGVNVKKIYKFALSIPLILMMAIVITNHFSPILFYVEQGIYYKGYFNQIQLIIYILYAIAIFVIMWQVRDKRSRPFINVSFVIPFILVAGIGLQFVSEDLFGKKIIMNGTVAAMLSLIIYIVFEKRKINIDEDLCGIKTKKAFHHCLNNLGNASSYVAMLNINKFKTINDIYGEAKADEIMNYVAKLLMKYCGINTYHYSIDIFTFVLPCNSYSIYCLEKIKDHFKTPIILDDKTELKIDVRITIVEYPKYANNKEELCGLIASIDEIAKRTGKFFIICDDDIIRKIQGKIEISKKIENAISNNGVIVHYQPVFSIEFNKYIGAEALVRLKDGEKLLYPKDFLDEAKEKGLTLNMDMKVLSGVLNFLSVNDINLGVSVNFSQAHFMLEGICDTILNMLKLYKINPSMLRIEITEEIVSNEIIDLKGIMEKLGHEGVKFYLDDFGTGYSNFASVLGLPFDVIKIDKSLLYKACEDKSNYKVLKNLVKALQEASYDVLVEGVETEQQLNIAKMMNINLIQGFYYSKAVPENKLLELLQ